MKEIVLKSIPIWTHLLYDRDDGRWSNMKQYQLNASTIILWSQKKAKPSVVSELYKKLKKADGYTVKNDVIYDNKTKVSVSVIACWRGIICVGNGTTEARFQRISVFHLGAHYRYEIPIDLVDKRLPFPTQDFSKKETEMIYAIADALATSKSYEETYIKIDRMECVIVEKALQIASTLAQDESLVLKLLRREPWILPTMVEAVLANLRPWIPKFLISNYLVAFVDGTMDSKKLKEVVSACNFTTAGCYEFQGKTKKDVIAWENYGCLISLLNIQKNPEKDLLTKSQSLETRNFRNITDEPFPAHPFLLVKQPINSSYVRNIILPNTGEDLAPEELDALRGFCAKILENPLELARNVIDEYQEIMDGPYAFRITSMGAWYKVVEEMLTQNSLEKKEAFTAVSTQFHRSQNNSKERIFRAVEYILEPLQYENEITVNCPENKDAVNKLLNEDQSYVAIRKKVGQEEYLLFTLESLKRMCSDLSEEEFQTFRELLDDSGILPKRSEVTPLKNRTSKALYRFHIQKAKAYLASPTFMEWKSSLLGPETADEMAMVSKQEDKAKLPEESLGGELGTSPVENEEEISCTPSEKTGMTGEAGAVKQENDRLDIAQRMQEILLCILQSIQKSTNIIEGSEETLIKLNNPYGVFGSSKAIRITLDGQECLLFLKLPLDWFIYETHLNLSQDVILDLYYCLVDNGILEDIVVKLRKKYEREIENESVWIPSPLFQVNLTKAKNYALWKKEGQNVTKKH